MKKLIYFILSFFIFCSPQTILAQEWSKEEKEILSQMRICWDAWMEGIHKKDPKIWFQKCPTDPNASMWWTHDGAPVHISSIERMWEHISSIDLDWFDLRPIKIGIYGDVAIIHFYGMWKVKSNNGPIINEYKDGNIQKNKWQMGSFGRTGFTGQ